MTSEHPRFTCHREGHMPILQVSNVSWTGSAFGAITWLSECGRCGEMVEQTFAADESHEESA